MSHATPQRRDVKSIQAPALRIKLKWFTNSFWFFDFRRAVASSREKWFSLFGEND
jgi:hypothetical protein